MPILMLTARDAEESRIKGLEIGADDYLAKPFEPRECRCGLPISCAPPTAERAAGLNRCGSVHSYSTSRAANCAAAKSRSA